MRLDHLLSKETVKRTEKVMFRKAFVLRYCLILKVLKKIFKKSTAEWGFSSAGRAPALHAGGQEFDPPNLHHEKKWK